MPKPLSTAVFYCTTRLLYPFPRPFARADSEDAGTGEGRAFAYPKRYAVLSLRLDTAFVFPADAQPEGEVPHIWRLPPSSLSSLSGGRAPPEVPGRRQADPQPPRAVLARGGFAGFRPCLVNGEMPKSLFYSRHSLKESYGILLNTAQ